MGSACLIFISNQVKQCNSGRARKNQVKDAKGKQTRRQKGLRVPCVYEVDAMYTWRVYKAIFEKQRQRCRILSGQFMNGKHIMELEHSQQIFSDQTFIGLDRFIDDNNTSITHSIGS